MVPISQLSLPNNECDRINVTIHKKSSLELRSSLRDQINDIINPKYLKKEKKENLKFLQEWHKNESIKTSNSPGIHLEGWARHSNLNKNI